MPGARLQHFQKTVAARPSSKAARDVDVSGKADIADIGIPKPPEHCETIERHIDIVQAADRDAGKRQRFRRHRAEG